MHNHAALPLTCMLHALEHHDQGNRIQPSICQTKPSICEGELALLADTLSSVRSLRCELAVWVPKLLRG